MEGTLATEHYSRNAVPEYKGETPVRAEDENYTYAFDRWDPHLMPVTRDIVYTARFKEYPKNPSAPIEDFEWIFPTDGTVIETDTCYYDDTPEFNSATPQKPGYSRFTYGFIGWSPEVVSVTGDAEYTAEFTETEKLFTGHSLTLKGDIGLNFFLEVTEDEIKTGSGVVVKFSWNVEGNYKTSEYKLSADEYVTYEDKKYYKAPCWVAVAEMTYTIHAEAYINGVLNNDTDDYTVKDYSMEILNAPEGRYDNQDELIMLVKGMLDYGAKAQILFSRKTDDLANRDVTDYTMTEIGYDTIPAKLSDLKDGVDEYGLEYYGTTIIYLTETTLRHYYKKTAAVSEAVKAAARASEFEYGERQGYVYFEKKNIEASELDTVQQISFDGSKYYGFSVLDYSRQVLMSSKMTYDEKQLAMATYWYNYYANIYFG